MPKARCGSAAASPWCSCWSSRCSPRPPSQPQFQVDPFWPKKLPNAWMLGQFAGAAVDANDHVWIMQRPRSLSRQESNAANNAGKCCRPAPP